LPADGRPFLVEKLDFLREKSIMKVKEKWARMFKINYK